MLGVKGSLKTRGSPEWVSSSFLLKEIFIGCAVSFKLPFEVRILMPGRYGSPLTAYVMLRAGPSRGQLIS